MKAPFEMGPHQLAWVESLESGRYQQARQALRTEDGFCCLGVACDVSGVGKWEQRRVLGGDMMWRFNKCREALPPEVMEWLAVKSCTCTLNWDSSDDWRSNMKSDKYWFSVTPRSGEPSLLKLNDGGMSFVEIAQFIRKDPGLVFDEPR